MEIKYCSDLNYSCVCCLPDKHEGPHICGCQGSWKYNEAGEMVPLLFPNGLTADKAMLALYNGLGMF